MHLGLFWGFAVVAWTPLLIAAVQLDAPVALSWAVLVRNWAVTQPYGKFWLVFSGVLLPLDKVLDLVYGNAKANWISPTLFVLLAAVLTYGVYRRDHESQQERRDFEAAFADQQAALESCIAEETERTAREARIAAREAERRILQLIDERMPRRDKS